MLKISPWFLAQIACFAVLAVLMSPDHLLGTARVSDTRPPNFVFILADDLGWGDLHCYGHPHIRTPGLDRLADEGVLFTQFYVAGPVCAPSRVAFMTGRFSSRIPVEGLYTPNPMMTQPGLLNYLDPAIPTVAKVLKEAGYATAHFGKWHLGIIPRSPKPAAYGVDEFRGSDSTGENVLARGSSGIDSTVARSSFSMKWIYLRALFGSRCLANAAI